MASRTALIAPDASPARYHNCLLRRFLETYWFRPENAFWMNLRSETLAQAPWAEPAIDLGCGDGVFMFLHAGGSFDPDFDVFRAVGHLDQVRTQHADMFDAQAADYHPAVLARPMMLVNSACDLKASMVEKARKLQVYESLIRHDLNTPLPYRDAQFATAYCNTAYWVERVDALLAEMRRITKPEGHVVLHVKIADMKDYTLARWQAKLGERFLDIIGRGRFDTWPSLADRATWEARFDKAGLRVIDVAPMATRTHAHIWDIGLRPIAPLLVKMTENLNEATRSSIKREWVDLFMELCAPLCSPAFDLSDAPAEPAELQYVLSPR